MASKLKIERKRENIFNVNSNSSSNNTTNFKDIRSMYRCCFGFVNRVIFFRRFVFVSSLRVSLSRCVYWTHRFLFILLFLNSSKSWLSQKLLFLAFWFETSKHFYSERSRRQQFMPFFKRLFFLALTLFTILVVVVVVVLVAKMVFNKCECNDS